MSKKRRSRKEQRETSRGSVVTDPRSEKEITRERRMDGANFASELFREKTPIDFVTNPQTGLRPGERIPAKGAVVVDLSRVTTPQRLRFYNLPPRSIWEKGKWKSDETDSEKDFNTWVTSGEGTPGNYVTREYVLPDVPAYAPVPEHPSDWSDNDFPKEEKKSSWWTPPAQSSPPKASSGIPSSVRVRCGGCGHFYEMDDLVDHNKSGSCPADQGEVAMFVMMCECCSSLQEAATVLPSFGKKEPVASGSNSKKKEEVTA